MMHALLHQEPFRELPLVVQVLDSNYSELLAGLGDLRDGDPVRNPAVSPRDDAGQHVGGGPAPQQRRGGAGNPCAAAESSSCDAHATCRHTGPGLHECTCLDGFEGNGGFCQEAADSGSACEQLAADGHASLVNTPDTRAQHFW